MASNSAMTRTTNVHAPPPIDRLPNELLLKIFVLGTIDTEGTYFPFLVATICHHWRFLSINDANLWTSLTLTPMVEVPPVSSDRPLRPSFNFPKTVLDPRALQLAFAEMPRLEKWICRLQRKLGVLRTSTMKDTTSTTSRGPGTHLYPALTEVIIIGVPVAWSHFSASNLRKLVLEKYPLDHRMTMQTLHGILSNSKDTLESLTLTWAVASEVDWVRSRLLLKRLTLPRVNDLGMGYIDPQEACQVLHTFEFPALHKLKLRSLDEGIDSSSVLTDMMKYLPLEQLEKLDLLKIGFPPGPFPNRNLVKNGSIAEESLPLLLQFIRRLVRVHDLGISACSDALLKYMNYSKGESINMPGVKTLWLYEDTRHPEVVIVPFLRERVKLGIVDGKYVGEIVEVITPFTVLCMGKPSVEYPIPLEMPL
ncbi:hypothetical protein IW261DRAFT_1594298 [Armillaria novae-zelandiae]|uniref:F-box domain-containing protein n=1 Tax=Armillaria novae-zelandiae TaxID=153914 RepID=A0AA39P586_9AGAR|nr:hypothetical protein IW261DRAFT_1594298 [Armillaria novae-zelandiae]